MNIESRYDFACELAKEAGALALGYFNDLSSLTLQTKGVQDMATEADVNTENLIRKAISDHYPEDHFLGEESYETFDVDAAEKSGAGIWVVDPIDGTQPFVCGIPTWCISIAFVVANKIEIGVIYDPNNDELFAARAGHGAFVNGKPISASAANDVSEGLVGIGFSNRVSKEATLKPLERLLEADGMFHRCGSGALTIAYVACGRLIGYYEPHMNSWDAVAGALLVTEAGGRSNDFLSDKNSLIAGNPVLASGSGLYDQLNRFL